MLNARELLGDRVRRRLGSVGVAVAAIAAEVLLNMPLADWHDRVPPVAAVVGIAIAVLAAVLGGPLPALVAVAVGWTLNAVYVADGWAEALLTLPAWIAAAGAAAWLALRSARTSSQRRLAEGRLSAVRELAGDSVVLVDAEGTITGWSPGAEASYGYSRGEVIGRPLADLFAAPEAAERFVESLRGGDALTGELVEGRRRDGRVFPASASVVPTAVDGEPPREGAVVTRDVGEVRRITERLRDTETRHRSLTEHLPLVTYVRSADGDRRMVSVSPQIDRLLGYTPDEWLADPGLFLRLVHPDDRERVAADHAAVDGARRIRSSYRMTSRDGRTVWVQDEAVLVLDERGRPLCIQGYLLDLSARKAAEEERDELRTAIAAAGADVRDRQRKLEFVAEAASVLASSLEFTSTVGQVAALATRELAEWCLVDVVDEDGSVRRLAAERAEPRSSVGEPEPPDEHDVRAFTRERRPELSEAAMRLPLVSRGGRAIGVLSFASGERERRYTAADLDWARATAAMIALAVENARLYAEVEARSDANKVLTHVGDGVFLLDRGGVIRLWNPAAAAITGIPAETALGKPAADAIPGWTEIAERAPVGTTRELVDAETLPLATDHGERWISISAVGFFGGTVYAFRDTTEAHRLDELKAEFIATASHELRTPLAAVYGAAQTLRRHDFALDEAGRERFVSLIVDESERLARIVNQILLANQLEVGRLDLVTEPFDAADLVERVVDAARTYAPPQITFDVVVEDDVAPVAADKDRVRQILVNLVDNAIKYSPGGGRIELGVASADGATVFRVADEGMGIPADQQRRIFEKFYRLDPDMTKGIGGTGLGLYICSELVERMGGRIWVESQENEGSSFFVQLPALGSHRVAPALDRSPLEHVDSPQDVRA